MLKLFSTNIFLTVFFKKSKRFLHFLFFPLPAIYLVGRTTQESLSWRTWDCSEKETRGTPCFSTWTFSSLSHGNSSGHAAQCQHPTSTLLSHTFNQEGLWLPDKSNLTLAIGQTVLGRSASSFPWLPSPNPDVPFDLAVVYWRFPERGWITRGPKTCGVVKRNSWPRKRNIHPDTDIIYTLSGYHFSCSTWNHPLSHTIVCVPWPSSCQPLKINHLSVAVTEFVSRFVDKTRIQHVSMGATKGFEQKHSDSSQQSETVMCMAHFYSLISKMVCVTEMW